MFDDHLVQLLRKRIDRGMGIAFFYFKFNDDSYIRGASLTIQVQEV